MPGRQSIAAKEVLFLTIPQLGLMLCHLAVSVTDLWVAGQLDGKVLAALGFMAQIFSFLMLVTSIVGSGCMATVSQALGARKTLRARRYAGLILGVSLLSGTAVALLGGALLRFLPLPGLVPDTMLPVVRIFASAYMAQLPFYYSLIMLNSIFRAHKLVWLPFATLCLVAGFNFIGSVGLGLGWWGWPRLGYHGVAWTTFAASVLGFACNMALGVRTGILRRESFASWRWNRLALPRLWRIGAPAALGNVAGHAGSIVLLGCVSSLPHGAVEAVAGMTLGSRIMSILYFPVGALGMTLTIMTGHLLGGGRAEEGYRLGLRCAAWTGLAVTVAATLLYLCREQIGLLFSQDMATVRASNLFLLIFCAILPLAVTGILLHAVLAGAGATRITCRISCITKWCFAVPAAYALGHGAGWGVSGVYGAMAGGEVLCALWTLQVYMRKKWLGEPRAL